MTWQQLLAANRGKGLRRAITDSRRPRQRDREQNLQAGSNTSRPDSFLAEKIRCSDRGNPDRQSGPHQNRVWPRCARNPADQALHAGPGIQLQGFGNLPRAERWHPLRVGNHPFQDYARQAAAPTELNHSSPAAIHRRSEVVSKAGTPDAARLLFLAHANKKRVQPVVSAA